jgi:hypothetical protein
MSTGGTLVDTATQEVIGYLAGSDEQVAANVGEGRTLVPGPYTPEVRESRSCDREQEARDLVVSATLAQIEQLERAQLRPMRELALNRDSERALERLRQIDDQIRKLRSIVLLDA